MLLYVLQLKCSFEFIEIRSVQLVDCNIFFSWMLRIFLFKALFFMPRYPLRQDRAALKLDALDDIQFI